MENECITGVIGLLTEYYGMGAKWSEVERNQSMSRAECYGLGYGWRSLLAWGFMIDSIRDKWRGMNAQKMIFSTSCCLCN
jgi:hypothetical protein